MLVHVVCKAMRLHIEHTNSNTHTYIVETIHANMNTLAEINGRRGVGESIRTTSRREELLLSSSSSFAIARDDLASTLALVCSVVSNIGLLISPQIAEQHPDFIIRRYVLVIWCKLLIR